MDYKRIESWRDLEEFGIIPLTGESCAIGLRLLCDLTPEGVELLESYLGGGVQFRKGTNWNSSQGQVASVTLAHSEWANIAVYALAREWQYVVKIVESEFYPPQVVGMDEEEWSERKEIYDKHAARYRIYWQTNHPQRNLRNVHHFSGRAE